MRFFFISAWASLAALVIFLLWAVFGNGEWYYPIIALIVLLFSNYKYHQAERHSMGKIYSLEWISIPEEEKRRVVAETLKTVVAEFHPNEDVYEVTDRFGGIDFHVNNIINGITEAYVKSNVPGPYQIACRHFIENYWRTLIR